MRKRITIYFVIFSFLFGLPVSAALPNDPLYGQQWYLHVIEAPSAWETTTGSSQVVVAVLDTGIDLDHPDLKENIWRNAGEIAGDGLDNDRNGFIDDTQGWNFVENNARPTPPLEAMMDPAIVSHGTAIAGIIAAVGNNAEGVAGIGWHTRLMPIRVLDNQGASQKLEPVLDGIRYAVQNGADIINLSFVAEFQDNTDEKIGLLREVLELAKNSGVIVVAAIGNDAANGGRNTDLEPLYPVCLDGPLGEQWVLGVAALGRDGRKSFFSNYGENCVDLSAPGEEMTTTLFSDPGLRGSRAYTTSRSLFAGTSMAAPVVSGAAALVKAAAPRLRRQEIVDALLYSSDAMDHVNPGLAGKLGRGRVNAFAAVRAATARSQRALSPTVAVSGEDGPPRVWLFNDVGTLINGFLAYEKEFRGGVRIASGDVDGDGFSEIITAPGPGRPAEVRIFDESGKLEKQFLGFEEEWGATVAVGDLDGNGQDEIVIGAGTGTEPRVRVFGADGALVADFLAYASSFRGGVEVAVGNIDGIGGAEIITGVRSAGGPHIRIFDRRGNFTGQFFAFEETYRNGVRLGAADVGSAAGEEILVARGGGESARLFEVRFDGREWNSFLTFAEDRDGPLAISARPSSKAPSEIFVVGAKRAESFPLVHGFTPIGALISAFPVPRELGVELHIATL